MAIVLLSNNSPGAPTFNNTAGALIAILDFALLPNGWSKIYTGTNKAAYRSALSATQGCLRVDDSGTTYATVTGYMTMSDVDTGTDRFPALGTDLYAHKATNASNTPWRLITDGQFFYFFSSWNAASADWAPALWFGDLKTYLAVDNFHCALLASITTTYNSGTWGNLDGTSTGAWIARGYAQTGVPVALARLGTHPSANGFSHNTGPIYPANVGTGLILAEVEAWQGNYASPGSECRGTLPGLYCPMNNCSTTTLTDLQDTANYPLLPGRTFTVHKLTRGGTNAIPVFDMTGPWR